MKVTTKQRFTLQGRDFWIGLLQAVGTVVLTLLLEQVKSGLGYDWTVLIDAAIAAALTYLLKNFFEPTKTVAIAEDEFEAKQMRLESRK